MAKAGRLFFSSDATSETLYSRIVPTEEQTEYLRQKWNDLAEYLAEDLRGRSGYSIRTWLQGSYKYATVIRPLGLTEEYDVDLGVYFSWNADQKGTPAPSQIRQWTQEALHSYAEGADELHQVAEPAKERCSRAHYAKQFHIDVPVYHLDENADERRLATLTLGWEPSDPKKLYQWFKECVSESERPLLRRCVRYAKAWAARTFQNTPAARPSSVLLTVLVAEAMQDLSMDDTDDEDAFGMVIASIHRRLGGSDVVLNPIDAREDLNRIPPVARGQFRAALDQLTDVCARATQADDEAAAAWIWDEVFGYLFPPPDDAEVATEGEIAGRALVVTPDIEVRVYDAQRRWIRSHRNEVPQVDKGFWLKFAITNRELVPHWATIDWVVRNSGDESSGKNDFGHELRDTRDFEHEEHTAYNGRHFMDCAVRSHGRILAVRRVPVYVREPLFTQSLPAKPYYRRLVKRRR